MDFLEEPPKPSKKTAHYKAKAAMFAALRRIKKAAKEKPTGPRYPVRIIKPGND